MYIQIKLQTLKPFNHVLCKQVASLTYMNKHCQQYIAIWILELNKNYKPTCPHYVKNFEQTVIDIKRFKK